MSAEPNGKQNWLFITSIISTLAVLIAGAWVIIDLKIENSVDKATSAKNEEIAALRAQQIAAEALLNARLIEVESQFRAEDQLRNVQWADMRRTMSLLWKRTYGEDYPTQQFYPSIARDPK